MPMKKSTQILIGAAIIGAIYFINYLYQKEQVKSAIQNATVTRHFPVNNP
jgi:hypothetical protein